MQSSDPSPKEFGSDVSTEESGSTDAIVPPEQDDSEDGTSSTSAAAHDYIAKDKGQTVLPDDDQRAETESNLTEAEEKTKLDESTTTATVQRAADDPPPVPSKASSPETTDTPPTDQPTEPVPLPERRRPKPPTRGILRPPPPPPKATLGGRLRDMVGSVTGEAPTSHVSGERAVIGTLNAISGRLGLGFGRFAGQEHAAPPPPPKPRSSVPPRAGSLPNGPPPGPIAQHAERPRMKRPLRRATFVLPSLSITYPISSLSEPWSKKVLEDRETVSMVVCPCS